MPSGRIADSRMENYTPCEKLTVSLSKELYDRMLKFMADEERGKSWVVQHALDAWLKKKGY